jgi:hypothetical protein
MIFQNFASKETNNKQQINRHLNPSFHLLKLSLATHTITLLLGSPYLYSFV